METSVKKSKVLRGGEFIIRESKAEETFIKDEMNEEQSMFANMTREFVNTRVMPNVPKIDKQDFELAVQLINEAGELGILGASLPTEYGGMGVDFNTEAILSEELGMCHSLGVSIAAHTGIGTLPILYYGTEDHKKKYLPGLATGQLKAAYCLTEPGSGSDALAAKTKAILSDDGSHYVVTGQKMWITNGGFADMFIVFAQVGGDKFTGFVVDAKSENINLGAEEDKMGIKGSSTRQVFFEGVKVPKENVLGEIGQGHRIAFNVLNIGRFKLCAMVMGGCKASIGNATKYANERIQFKVPISSFGAIKHKIAEMAIRTYAVDAATYRTSGLITDMISSLKAEGKSGWEAKLQAAEEYSIECAMLKVFGSETLDYCVDEAVQIYGGTGFSEEYPVARAYRDSRINRIFEGTNEINRLLTVDMLLKKALRGDLDLLSSAMAVQKELMAIPDFGTNGDTALFHEEKKAIQNAKKAALVVAGAAVQKFQQKLQHEQEIIMYITDMLIDIFAAESTLLKTEKLAHLKSEEEASLQIDISKTFISDALERIHQNGKSAVNGFAEGDEQRVMLMGIKRFTKYKPFNTIQARRRIADAIIKASDYCF
ncbi:MAG: acyl-CoA dehydrogenase [Chitinophagales bacterium]|nr:acyl-CoA dehydrogenase [Chitinophagales bacterium]